MLLKSIFDKFVAILLLSILLIPLLVIAILVVIFMGYPVLYTQNRPGLKGEIFKMFKFRSMTNAKDANGNLLPNKDRITSLGSFLRKSSLDELPGLLNVLNGDMSLVGPRPLLVSYLPLYSPKQARRHEVKPGLTGWAQINGRNAISWERKFEYDIWYIDNWSFWLDLKILYKTAIKVIKREGINADEAVTMQPFTGTLQK